MLRPLEGNNLVNSEGYDKQEPLNDYFFFATAFQVSLRHLS